MQDEAIFFVDRGWCWKIRHSPRNFFAKHHEEVKIEITFWRTLRLILGRNRGIGGLRNVDNYLRQIYRM